MGPALMTDPGQDKKTGKKKKKPTTTMKAHIPFAEAVGQLSKLKESSIPDELDRYLKFVEDDLLTELARRQAAIERSRQK